MAYLEILQQHNADLSGLIDKANSLPEKGDLGKQVDALIDKSITEIYSEVTGNIGAYLFQRCYALTSANLPNATSVGDYAFDKCEALTSLYLPNVQSVGQYAFQDCKALPGVDLPIATSIGNVAFQRCKALTSVNLPNVTSMGWSSFYGCEALTSVNLEKLLSVVDNVFNSCYGLKNVVFPKVIGTGYAAFQNCRKLESADFSSLTNIASQLFYNCYSLKSVVLRSETVCTLANTNAFQNCYHILGTVNATYNPTGAKDGYFYVPRALVDSYKAMTNWVTYATQFRALEDYTVDGTITGALDPNKI